MCNFCASDWIWYFAGTQLLSTTLGVKDYVQSEFLKVKEQVILPHNHLFPPITLDDFLWAFGILRSRAFSRLRGESLVLIPFADLVRLLSFLLWKTLMNNSLGYPKSQLVSILQGFPYVGLKMQSYAGWIQCSRISDNLYMPNSSTKEKTITILSNNLCTEMSLFQLKFFTVVWWLNW